jgi:hypothetical protein
MVDVSREIKPYFLNVLLITMAATMFISSISAQPSSRLLEQYFESRGFKTGNIDLPFLGIRVNLECNRFYLKEEDVTDIQQRIAEIRAGFGLSVLSTHHVRCCGWCGVVDAEYNRQKAYGYVVLIKKNLNLPTRIYTHAHENGHFLWYIGKQEMILQKFKNSRYLRSKITSNDEFAELCGWLAVKLAGYDLDNCIIQGNEKRAAREINRIKSLVRDDPLLELPEDRNEEVRKRSDLSKNP